MGKALASRARSRKAFLMNGTPQSKLDPRVKNVWRVNDVIWIVLGYLCCAVPFAICAAIEPAPWVFVLVAVLSAIAAVLLVAFLVVLPPIRYVRWRYELHDDYLDIAKGIIWRKRYIIPFIRVQNTDTRQGPILRAFGNLERHRRHGRWRSCDPRACERRRRPGARPRGRACPHRARGHVMDGPKPREPRMRENRERHAVHSSYIWLGGLQGAAAVFAALLVGVLPQIIPELFNPDSLGQFVNGGLAAIIIVLLFPGHGHRLACCEPHLSPRVLQAHLVRVRRRGIQLLFGRLQQEARACALSAYPVGRPDSLASPARVRRVHGADRHGGRRVEQGCIGAVLRKADAEALRADLFARKSAAVGAPFREADAPSSFGNVLDAPAEVWDDVRGVFAGSEVDTGRISFQYGITNSESHSHRTFEQHDAGSRRRRQHRRVGAGRRLRLANGGRGWRSRCRSARRRGPRAFRQQPHCPYRCREPSRCPCSCG